MTPIERAARALYSARLMKSNVVPLHNARDSIVGGSWELLQPNIRASYIREACALLLAIREPSEEMIAAAHDIELPDELAIAQRYWSAMIDAALAEGV